MTRPSVRIAVAVLLLTGSLVRCGSDGGTGPDLTVPSALSLISGDSQVGTVGQALGQTLVVRVLNVHGNPLAGTTVNWAVATGGGTLSGGSSVTNAQGDASITWTLGTAAGTNNNTARATAAGLPSITVTFTASANPGPATQLSLVSGNAQTASAGEALAQPLIVSTTDQYGNRVSGKTVDWSVIAGSGQLSVSSNTTDAEGRASVSWTVGRTAGSSNQAQATATGLSGSPVLFSATARAGPPAAITRITGDAQTDSVGATLPLALVVEVRDPFDNAVPSVQVNWTSAGGGSVSPLTSMTDALGRASSVRTLGVLAGTANNTTTASLAGVPNVQTTFTASVNPGAAVQMLVESGNAQTARAATVLPDVLRTRVADTHGNGVPGVSIQWKAGAGSGATSAIDVVSIAGGFARAHWTLGAHPGSQSATATAIGTATSLAVNFTANATPNGTIAGNITTANVFTSPSMGPKAAKTTAPPAPLMMSFKTRASKIPVVGARPKSVSSSQAVPEELIVTFRANRLKTAPLGSAALAARPNTQAAAQAIRARLAVREAAGELQTRGISPVLLAARVRVSPSRMEEVADRLRRDPDVAAVARNILLQRHDVASAGVTPNDPFYLYQAWHYAMIDVPEAWTITHGSASVLVAIVDDGIRFDHPGLTTNLTSDGYDFVSDIPIPLCAGGNISNTGDGGGYDLDPTIPASYALDPFGGCVSGADQYGGHGLHVAGTIGEAGNNAVGGTGVNWTGRIRPVRALGVTGMGTVYDVAQALLYAAGLPADNGAGGTVSAGSAARIINLSLGTPVPDVMLENAVIAANNAGSLIVASAGNGATSDPMYPAAYPQALSVTALGPDAQLASYSSFGSTVDIAAPGGDFADGDFTFGIISTFWDFNTNTAVHVSLQGTSMAAPHVSGVAALVLSQDPGLTTTQLRNRLTSYAFDLGASGHDEFYGAGLLNARNSLTQTFDYPRALYARLYNATTGAPLATVPADVSGGYAFNELDDLMYYVYAGQDQSGDQQVGAPGRRWSAFGGAAIPSDVVVDGAGTYPTSFTIGFPSELEFNGSPEAADALALGGYIIGFISSPSTDADYTWVQIPQAGLYTFETSAFDGACGFALEEDTIISLYDPSGVLIAQMDDIDFANANFCSRLSVSLNAGIYYLRITGYYGGRYQLQARIGP